MLLHFCQKCAERFIEAVNIEQDCFSEQLSEPARLEGKTSDWLLIDSSDVIVHVFLPEAREHFNLERVWADAEEL